MPTDTARTPTHAARFALRAVVWSLGLFGLFRLNWIEAHVVLPVTRVQAGFAVALLGTPTLPIEVTLACSGADALALCLGAILAYPVTWRTRLEGAGGGAALILCLNTLRIGTLGRTAASPVWFNTLHVYVWPAVLTLAIAGYVFGWMRLAGRRRAGGRQAVARQAAAPLPTRRFIVLAAVLLLLFAVASPLYLQSASVYALAGFIARAAAAMLGAVGVSAYSVGNVLWTPRGSFLVTQECISTPLIPVYLAAVGACSKTRRRLIVGVLAAGPLFVALAVVRLLVVALPPAVLASPIFLVHAFYQLLLGAVVVFLAALWRYGGRAAPGSALAGITAGFVFVVLLGPAYTRLVTYPAGVPLHDPQGALALLPAFQVGLYLALWVAAFVAIGWKWFLSGLAVLAFTQITGLLIVQALATFSGITAQVRDVRAWAVAGPVLIFAAVVNGARARR